METPYFVNTIVYAVITLSSLVTCCFQRRKINLLKERIDILENKIESNKQIYYVPPNHQQNYYVHQPYNYQYSPAPSAPSALPNVI